jgi:hypothetical protein
VRKVREVADAYKILADKPQRKMSLGSIILKQISRML